MKNKLISSPDKVTGQKPFKKPKPLTNPKARDVDVPGLNAQNKAENRHAVTRVSDGLKMPNTPSKPAPVEQWKVKPVNKRRK